LGCARTANAQTTLKFSLDGRLEGPSALFVHPQDRSYFRQEGLDVVIDEARPPSTHHRSPPAATTSVLSTSMR
jgi:hypothetical protein